MAISLGQLDLEALKNYLKIVQGFRTVNDPAMDTEHVDGVASNLIAIASIIEDQLLKDENGKDRRDVINHALNLLRLDEFGEQTIINANDILTAAEGQGLKDVAQKAAKNTAEDMRQLRNEMYHLKTKMIRSGAVSFDQVYNGWIDPFVHYIEDEDDMDGRFTKDKMSCSGNHGDISSTAGESFETLYDVGQFGVLMSGDKAIYADEITHMSGSYLMLGDGTTFIDSQPDAIQKSYGLYHKGQFIFANNKNENVNTDNFVNMIYKDGANRIKIMELNEEENVMGFGTVIEVPAELDENYLNAVGLSIRAVGKPGQIWCELYHWNEEAIYDPSNVIAISEFLNSDRVTNDWKTHKFYFRDTDIKMESGHKYLLLIKGTGTWNDNVWCLGGFEEVCNMSVHQDTFIYRNNNNFLERILPNATTNMIYDAFVSLFTTETEQVILNYSRFGAYTGTFNLENALARRVRISFNPNLNGKQKNPELFRVEDYYKVSVKGQTADGEIVMGMFDEEAGIKRYSHVVISNNEVSADEYAYDFIMPEEVVKIEFQIMYNSTELVDETKHGSLFSVVVSTDNAYIESEGGF